MSVYPATLNGGLFSGFDLDSLKGKAATTVTVKIPVSGEKVAIRQTNKALAGASTDGRVSDGVKFPIFLLVNFSTFSATG